MTVRTTRQRAVTALTATMCAVLVAGLAACGSDGDSAGAEGGDGDVSLRIAWSGSDERNTRTQDALDLFMEQNPNVDISVEYTTATNFWDRLTTQVAGGNAPDIIQMSGQVLSQYATSDVLLDLGPFVDDGTIDVDGWEEEPLEAQTIDGTLYGIPPGLDGHALVYDATKLQELGIEPPSETWTWSEFADLAREIAAAGGEGYYGTEDGGPQYEVLQSFLNQRGKQLFDGNELGFEAADVEELWQFWGDLREDGAAVPADLQTAQGANPENSGVVQGYAAMDFTTSSQYTNFVGLSPGEVGMATYPFGDDGEPGQVWRAGMAWSITRTSANAETAAELIDFLVNDSEAGALLQTTRGVPASPTIREEVLGTVDETEQRSFEHLETVQAHDAQVTPVLPTGFGDFNDLYQRLYYEYAFGRMSLEDAVGQLMSEAPGLLG